MFNINGLMIPPILLLKDMWRVILLLKVFIKLLYSFKWDCSIEDIPNSFCKIGSLRSPLNLEIPSSGKTLNLQKKNYLRDWRTATCASRSLGKQTRGLGPKWIEDPSSLKSKKIQGSRFNIHLLNSSKNIASGILEFILHYIHYSFESFFYSRISILGKSSRTLWKHPE